MRAIISRSVKVISAIIPWAGIPWTIILWAALLPGSVQAQFCAQLCDEDFWPTATVAQVRTAIANEGVAARSEYGDTPLHSVSANDTPEAVNLLLAAGADIKARNKYGRTPLHSVAGRPQEPQALPESKLSRDYKAMVKSRIAEAVERGKFKSKATALAVTNLLHQFIDESRADMVLKNGGVDLTVDDDTALVTSFTDPYGQGGNSSLWEWLLGNDDPRESFEKTHPRDLRASWKGLR